MKLSTNRNIVWQPIPNTSQELAVDTRCHETLLCGTRGGGKTDCQLAAFGKYLGVGYGRYWRGIIFDQKNKSLNDIILKSQAMFKPLGGTYNIVEKTWTFPTGETLRFAILRLNEDYWNFHGQEYSFIGFNELTKYSTSYLYDSIKSCNRSGFLPEKNIQYTHDGKPYLLPTIPLMMFSTTNPHGAGHNWVKKRFITVAPYGTVVKRTDKIYNPKTQKEELITRTQVAIFSSFIENCYLDPVYVQSLLTYPDPNIRKAWALGSWDIVSGGAIGDLWDSNIHIIPRFRIPKGWYVDRTFDWGSSHPFSVGWWAQANGEEADILLDNGKWIKFCPPKGSLIQLYEWYGTEEIGTNKGLMMSATDIAKGINEIEESLVNGEWISYLPNAGSADNQIWNNINSDTDCIASFMERENIYWTRSDKSSGSRKNGLQLLRELLNNTLHKDPERPHIYFMVNCVATINTLPILPRDEKNLDDVDTNAEDHTYDMIRYRVLDGVRDSSINLEVDY